MSRKDRQAPKAVDRLFEVIRESQATTRIETNRLLIPFKSPSPSLLHYFLKLSIIPHPKHVRARERLDKSGNLSNVHLDTDETIFFAAPTYRPARHLFHCEFINFF
jgi:hypothetical protein